MVLHVLKLHIWIDFIPCSLYFDPFLFFYTSYLDIFPSLSVLIRYVDTLRFVTLYLLPISFMVIITYFESFRFNHSYLDILHFWLVYDLQLYTSKPLSGYVFSLLWSVILWYMILQFVIFAQLIYTLIYHYLIVCTIKLW